MCSYDADFPTSNNSKQQHDLETVKSIIDYVEFDLWIVAYVEFDQWIVAYVEYDLWIVSLISFFYFKTFGKGELIADHENHKVVIVQ